ncbi:MAG: hypothetical protein JWN55_792 [Frankiales bacterium]|jgi:hypothetical protein|nr:hypothetical protein [Frankiales bacterium]
MTPSRTARLRRLTVLAVVASLALPVAGARAQAAAEQPVVFGPTLGIFDFGADVGLPLACTLALGYARDGADLFGQAEAADPVFTAAGDGCAEAGAQGKVLLAQGRTAAQPAVALNPYVNPVLGQAAESLRTVGTDYAELVSPFGPTIAGSGDTIDFFQGR